MAQTFSNMKLIEMQSSDGAKILLTESYPLSVVWAAGKQDGAKVGQPQPLQLVVNVSVLCSIELLGIYCNALYRCLFVRK